jgi:excisionase family DNA binding protein
MSDDVHKQGAWMEDRQLSLSEVAGLMGVSERTVRRWIKSGKLRAYKPGRDYRIPESAFREFVEESEISPKAHGRSSPEPSLFNGLEDERRLRYLRGWRAFVHGLARRWEKEPPKTSAEISPLFEAMTALVEQGVFEPSGASTAEAHELTFLTLGFQRLNEIADKVGKDEEAEQRRAAFQVIQQQQEQRSA